MIVTSYHPATIDIVVKKYHAELQMMTLGSPNKGKWNCSDSCYFCCNGPISITFSEILYISNKIKEHFEYTFELKADLEKYIDSIVECVDYYEHSLKCVFLKNNNCMIYSFRPSVRRKYFSTNKQGCIRDLPISTFVDKYCMTNGLYLLSKFRHHCKYSG